MKSKLAETGELLQKPFNLAESLETKILLRFRQINPQINSRQKRGLINALGSVIKVITGNLDQQDPQNYDKAIATLTHNQKELKTLNNQQITLLKESINKFKNITQSLSQNQIKNFANRRNVK